MTSPSVPESRPPVPSSLSAGRIIAGLMLAVLVWGVYLAVGSYRYGRGRADLRAATILAATLAFLGLWGAMLWWRQRQTGRGEPSQSVTPPEAGGQPPDAPR